MFNPIATYRIQFHKDFTFRNLKEIIPYLKNLGIKTLYASPIFEATPGSTHGYDVVNPLKINPEIGTLDELRLISKKLKDLNINWLQDIVPNHMAYHPNNAWLMDVLEKGRESAYASFFDIEWDSPIYDGRIMVPFLGVPFDEAVEQKQIQLIEKDDKLWFEYFDQRYPVKLPYDKKITQGFLDKANNDPQQLKQIAVQQAYQLCHWQETDRQINYRRFFTVNGLICLNMQHEVVFTKYHELIKQLLEEDVFQGLRVDHVDGLADPKGYLERLRQLTGPDTYITVEKILEKGEDFPASWPVQGNTGYDFLALVNNLFTNAESKNTFTDNYKKVAINKKGAEESIFEKKAYILTQHMAGELENLSQLFKTLKLLDDKDLSSIGNDLKEAIGQVLIHCPVYRFYGNEMPLPDSEVSSLRSVINAAGKTKNGLKPALQLLQKALLEQTLVGDVDYNQRALRFYQRCMQFTGPLMAKGVEDTLMYTYNRFIGHNEVGDSPTSFGLKKDDFHNLMIARQQNWPLSINATSTHDTKRGEDVRARLNVLTDMPAEWFELVKQWQDQNSELKTTAAPDKNDEYFIYQSLLGAYPMPQTDDSDLEQRIQDYLLKSLREGKTNSDWAAPNEEYEDAVKKFIAKLLAANSTFRKTVDSFYQQVADYGIINSLAQVLLKFTCPGVPDLYQGCEFWDLSLVDPDNRRPVDYQLGAEQLPDIEKNAVDDNFWKSLWQKRYDGNIKLSLIKRLLALRESEARLFEKGDYVPLSITGKYKANVAAFARQLGKTWYVVAIPLHLAAIGADAADPFNFDWENTAVALPQAAPRKWNSVLSAAKGRAAETLPVTDLFKDLPLALIKLNHPENRDAGLLMHITSLPSAFGSGDIGPEAYRFIDFLFDGGQRYWQLLPVNPVDKGAGYSPYSASSSMAGNTLLISPELLVNDGYLNEEDVSDFRSASTGWAEPDSVVTNKTKLFAKAYERYLTSGSTEKEEFKRFKEAEDYWLNDFAIYQVFKQINKNRPWYEWPDAMKKRDDKLLNKANTEYATGIDKEKWLQYIFDKQWRLLKAYALNKGVTLFGDMPFYVSYDSVDVWSHPEMVKLDKQGKIAGIAGVPPDYFSTDGQLWGMPVYNWDVLKKNNYDWWLQRIRKNLEYFDLIRLDHFRAFIAFWEVPGGEKTAVNGRWNQGPGFDLFYKIESELGYLPFVAEDLGDVDEEVFQLRDQFGMPGMKVLQFAFGLDMPQSNHIPHNYPVNAFAYTGTHDNNTLKGWYRHEANTIGSTAINRYIGQKVSEKNVCATLIRLCYSSVAKVTILPVQDILDLDESYRMNTPSSSEGNWTWRVTNNQLTRKLAMQLRELTLTYNR